MDLNTFLHLQETGKIQKHIKKEVASETCYRIQENRNPVQNNGINFQHSKCMQDCNLIDGECRLSDSGLSSDRPYGEASTVPLHPTKRPASNPPPISNQATKGSVIICVLSFGNQFACCCHLYHMLILKCEYSENGFSMGLNENFLNKLEINSQPQASSMHLLCPNSEIIYCLHNRASFLKLESGVYFPLKNIT